MIVTRRSHHWYLGPDPPTREDWEAIRSLREDLRDPYLRAYLESAEPEEGESL